nr:unnamed protein product [Callosobruchus chinensis]
MNCTVIRENLPMVPEDIPYHPALDITLENISTRATIFPQLNDLSMYNFHKANFPGLYEELFLADWSFLDNLTDLNLGTEKFYSFIYNTLDIYVPKYLSHNRKYPPWFTSDIIRNIKRKAKLLRNFKHSGSISFLDEFKRLRSIIKAQLSSAYSNYLARVQASISNDPRCFWSYMHSKNKSSRIPGKLKLDDTIFDKPSTVVNGFAKFFESVFLATSGSAKHNQEISLLKPYSNLFNVHFNDITEDEILAASSRLKNKFTSGPDRIPSFFVRDCINVLVKPLAKLFNLSVSTCTFPDIWKLSKVCPILKSGDPADIKNYRPISILSNFAKLLEIVMYNRIYTAVHRSLSPFQHGFLAQRSTVTNLITFTQKAIDCVDRQGQLDVIYTDFAKDFDRIDHNILLSKLSLFGFHTSALTFIESYLLERKQYVTFNGYKSNEYVAKSGVPQGSNLGPLLFILFIDDIAESVNCDRLLFADDLKIFATVSSREDCDALQQEIQSIEKWCRNNQLFLNPSKCKILSFTRKKRILLYDYRIGDTILARCESNKDLGVIYDTKLTFAQHISQKINEASRFYGFIVRNCRSFSRTDALLILYSSYIRSKLEYACIIWNPIYKCYKESLERIQRKFLKFLAFRLDGFYPPQGISYSYLLSRFHIQSLDTRRSCASIAFLYKLLHNMVDANDILAQLNFYVPPTRTRNVRAFHCDRARTNLFTKSPIFFMCSSYNEICNQCDIYRDNLGIILEVAAQYFCSI